jgi:hypothetical protein
MLPIDVDLFNFLSGSFAYSGSTLGSGIIFHAVQNGVVLHAHVSSGPRCFRVVSVKHVNGQIRLVIGRTEIPRVTCRKKLKLMFSSPRHR